MFLNNSSHGHDPEIHARILDNPTENHVFIKFRLSDYRSEKGKSFCIWKCLFVDKLCNNFYDLATHVYLFCCKIMPHPYSCSYKRPSKPDKILPVLFHASPALSWEYMHKLESGVRLFWQQFCTRLYCMEHRIVKSNNSPNLPTRRL